MDESNTKWRFGGPPDYSLTNLYYLKQRSKEHPEDSLEKVVENLVKTWEMERSHKVDCKQHQSVDQKRFLISANGGKKYKNVEANEVGNYNVLLDACPAEVWDKEHVTREKSHDKFHTTFAAFLWKVLEVYSCPPSHGDTGEISPVNTKESKVTGSSLKCFALVQPSSMTSYNYVM